MARDGGDLVVDPWDASAIRREPDPVPDEVRHWHLAEVVRRLPDDAPVRRREFEN